MKKVRTVLADENCEYRKQLAKCLLSYDRFQIIDSVGSGTELKKLISCGNVELVIMDAILRDEDGIDVLEYAECLPEDKRPIFVVMTSFISDYVLYRLAELGTAMCISKNHDMKLSVDRICDVVNKKLAAAKKRAAPTIENVVCDIMDELGVPSHLKGRHYLLDAITAVAQNRAVVEGITKNLYPDMAKKYSTSATCVERAMRKAIEYMFNTGVMQTMQNYFGDGKDDVVKPSNSQFITLVSVRAQLRYTRLREFYENSQID